MNNRGVGFYDVLQAKREEMDVLGTVMTLERKVEALESEVSEMKTLLVRSMSQMQEIYLELLRERSKRSESNDSK